MPFADLVYGCDGDWWSKREGLPQFHGLKLTHGVAAAMRYPNLHRIRIRNRCDRILTAAPGLVGDGGNSGFQLINILVQFGVRRLILVGYDMRIDLGLHWHGRHDRGLNNPSDKNVLHWRLALDGVANDLSALGIEVLNASPVSALTAYRKVSLAEALA